MAKKYKRVNVIAKSPVNTINPPIRGTVRNTKLTIEQIRACIMARATVEEILQDGSTLTLTLANYSKDNNSVAAEDTTVANPEPVVETPVEEQPEEEVVAEEDSTESNSTVKAIKAKVAARKAAEAAASTEAVSGPAEEEVVEEQPEEEVAVDDTTETEDEEPQDEEATETEESESDDDLEVIDVSELGL